MHPAPESFAGSKPVQPEQNSKSMLEHLVCFSRTLSDAGITVNASNLIDLCRSFQYIHLANRQDFYHAAKAILISKQSDYDGFHLAFMKYWAGLELPGGKSPPKDTEESDQTGEGESQGQQRSEANQSNEGSEQSGQEGEPDQSDCSGEELLMKKDLASMSDDEFDQAREVIKQLASILATRNSRRTKIFAKGQDIEFRKVLRDNLPYGGEIIDLKYRKQKLKKSRVMLLCDVSGSMDKYSNFLIQIFYAMRQEIQNFDVAVFSTKTSVITPYLESDNVSQVLADVSDHVHDWAGGTNIGACIREFNNHFSREMSQSKTVMIILSDGWDRGESDIMRREMAHLKRKTHKLLWLNPLLANPQYKPLVKGMRTALPYLDHFLPVHSIESLEKVVTTLRSSLNN